VKKTKKGLKNAKKGVPPDQSPSRPIIAIGALVFCAMAVIVKLGTRYYHVKKQIFPRVPLFVDPSMNTLHHDPKAFTQGLLYHGGFLYESTGLYGESTVRKVDIESGAVLKSTELGNRFFGEGMTLLGNKLIVLTWKERTGFILDSSSLEIQSTFPYNTVTGEGWGLTNNGTHLIVSDGSHWLMFWDPETLIQHNRVVELGRKPILDNAGRPVQLINELEWVDGAVLANIWYKDYLVRIDPEAGTVVQLYNFDQLHNVVRTGKEDCFNGIAIDNEHNLLYVTGKWWNKLFRLQLKSTA